MDCLVILPTYNHLDYGLAAAKSFLELEPRCSVFVVDDASPEWGPKTADEFLALGRINVNRFSTNGGLTRSWNFGLMAAQELGYEYAVCGNSDILASPGCLTRLIEATKTFDLVGPLTNAPGRTCENLQGIWSYLPTPATDEPASRASIAADLGRLQPGQRVQTKINGFFMLARTEMWWRAAYDADHVYDPKNILIGNEDELQERWWRLGLTTGLALDSYIFHYRSVSREGRTRLTRGWQRRAG
jgi:GT2 family glycosyltransferase